jgi:hypothetical protein
MAAPKGSIDPGDLPRLTVREPQYRGRAIHVVAGERVKLPRAVVVDDNDEPVAGHRLHLKLSPDAGKKHFADSGDSLPFTKECPRALFGRLVAKNRGTPCEFGGHYRLSIEIRPLTTG